MRYIQILVDIHLQQRVILNYIQDTYPITNVKLIGIGML